MRRSKHLLISLFGLGLAVAGLMLFASQHQSQAVAREPIVKQPANNAKESKDAKGEINLQALLQTYCVSCHGPGKQEGKVRFDALDALTQDDRNEIFNLAHEMVHYEEMPPGDKPQPTKAERKMLLSYLSGQAGGNANAALKGKLRYPKYGNLVDHEQLFGGEITEPAYTPARRWLVNPQIFAYRVADVFELYSANERSGFERGASRQITNPFILPDTSGVRDYDTRMLTGGHLITMLGNAEWIAEKQLFATENHGRNKNDIVYPNPADKWYPGGFAPESFKAVLDASGKPTDEQIEAAIKKQFNLALRRPPGGIELDKYVAFTRSMIERGGNATGLKQMLRAVLLEGDFLYRVEFGGGEPDEYGRKKLTPHEAAHAISYALGDIRPDETLLAAANEGRLGTKADYRREVERLLAAEDYFRGMVDPRLRGTSAAHPIEVSHPKTIRFFREFFGYPMALSIFKDAERVEGMHVNAGRGTTGTAGAIVNEADQIVAWHVENDANVFENLLSSDKYFVYYRGKDRKETNHATVSEWREAWEKLKDTPWETESARVFEEHKKYFKSTKYTNLRDNRRQSGASSLRQTMRFFNQYFPYGKTPYPIFPWAHGNQQRHASLYSLPASRDGQYYSSYWDSLTDDQRNVEPWDFPIQQPFTIPDRKGILSHPAWLIAHAHNFQTDPVKRGLWIQEKLLANRVPDVPITVDAKVPEHPEKTLRTRLQEKTTASECWRCHQHMNPLGLPFEMYDDFGRFRTQEPLEHPENIIEKGDGKTSFNVYKVQPVDATGLLNGTGDSSLDGEVKNAADLIDRLAESDRVRQSILRHAFRFYMGRNEMLSDSRTLIDMDKAYLESGGSFKAVIVSLLTSDSFMYRKEIKD